MYDRSDIDAGLRDIAGLVVSGGSYQQARDQLAALIDAGASYINSRHSLAKMLRRHQDDEHVLGFIEIIEREARKTSAQVAVKKLVGKPPGQPRRRTTPAAN